MSCSRNSRSLTKPPPPTPTPTPPTSPSFFSAAVSKIAVAQICESIGYQSSQTSALESLSSILSLYLQALAQSASELANSSGRTECNLSDVVAAINHLNSNSGFHGASEPHKSVFNSHPMKEIVKFVRSVNERPFARPIRREAKKRGGGVWRSYRELGLDPPFKHVPPWLPPFPELEIRVRETEESESGGVEESEGLEPRGGEEKKMETRVLMFDRERVKFKLGLGFKEGFGVKRRKEISMGILETG